MNLESSLNEDRQRRAKATSSFNHGESLYRQARYREAEPRFRAAIARHSGYAKAWYYLGATLNLTGRLAEAEPVFGRAMALDPDFGRGRGFYGALLLRQRRPHRSVDEFERALGSDPNLGFASAGLGAAYEMLGNRSEAIRWYRYTARIDPSLAPEMRQRLARLGAR